MINRKHFSCAWIVFVVAVAGTHLGPECPRHRGLPAGFSRTENIYKNRALYRLDLRSAIKGYIPGKEYKLRVQTTFRKLKFNDATVVIDAIDERCGAGYWVTDTDELYSPKDCPAIVTTQQKEPMGRANFKWVAPSCGCVHFRVRVHANSTYYIEDETVRNGPLARTICPKVGTVTEPITKETTTTVMPEALTRNQRLKLLCDVTVVNKADSVMKNEDFLSRRSTSKLNSFEIERLNLAVEQRHLEVLTCCALETEYEKSECFADIRRVRIDTFCGDGEPDIPITETRYNWIKQRQPECCPQIGEDRYRCFNYTLNEEEMLKDSHGHHSSLDMDDFDPVNYVEDYPQADEIKMKFSKKFKQTRKGSHSDDSTETGTDDQYKTANETEHVATHGSHTNETYDTGNDLEEKSDVDTDESSSTDIVNAKNSEPMEDSRDDVQTRNLSIEECCMNGIDAGIKVLADGFDGCFKMADRFHAFFTKWNRRCDRHFVICCMRVIDGDLHGVPKSINLHKLLLPHKHACLHGKLLKISNNVSVSSMNNSSLNRFKQKERKLKFKMLKINKQNEVVKPEDDKSRFESKIDNPYLLRFRYNSRYRLKHLRQKERKHFKASKYSIVNRKQDKFYRQNKVHKHG